MDTQLSRFLRSMTARPCRSAFVPFDGTISSERVAPCACSRPPTRATNSRYLLSVVLGVGSLSANIGGG
jgi:hypothetical protein